MIPKTILHVLSTASHNVKVHVVGLGGASAHLKCIEQQLVLKFLDAQDLLKHVKELLLRHDELTVEGLLHPAWPFAVFFTC